MNAAQTELESVQLRAVAHPLDGAFVAIAGPAGTGKSFALEQRAKRALDLLRPHQRIILSAASELAVLRMRKTFAGAHDRERHVCAPLGDIAFEVLQRRRSQTAGEPPLALIDDVHAEELVALAGTALFALEWDELLSAEVDPEITGMRAPQRFAGTAYRLIRKLRMAGLSPEEFAAASLRGATAFYGHPPNFANPDLIEKTAAKYRNSLRVGAAELAHQHMREVDLSRILARLYRGYLEHQAERGWLTRVDALDEAAKLLEREPVVRAEWVELYRFAFIDDAQDLTQCDVRFMRALFGNELAGVTLAGDPDQRTLAFAGPRAEAILEAAPHRFALLRQWRSSAQIVQASRAALPSAPRAFPAADAVEGYRAETMGAEAAYVAGKVAQAIRDGVAPRDIAVIARSLRCADAYIEALLARDVPVDPAGEGSLYAFREVEDALGALWSVADPYRHDWLLRNLAAPWLSLSDASIVTLCGEPVEPQALLFELPAGSEDERGRRWNRRRDFRLAWNVLRGDRDVDLARAARERLGAFRSARRGWLAEERRSAVGALARTVLAQTVLAGDAASARGRLRRGLVERLIAQIDRFVADHPRGTLHDFLLYAERVATLDDDLLHVQPHDGEAVAILGVEASKGREFAHVYLVDVRAGAFPRYYVPDAFQFSPKLGMIPKENVGEAAAAARTAKFSYFQYKLDLRTKYYAEERRALYCAASRAREQLTVSASGRPTRGVGAPELLEELRPPD